VQQKLPSDPTLSQKRAVFPAFSSSEVTLGQMLKIGILFIIYPHLPMGQDVRNWVPHSVVYGYTCRYTVLSQLKKQPPCPKHWL